MLNIGAIGRFLGGGGELDPGDLGNNYVDPRRGPPIGWGKIPGIKNSRRYPVYHRLDIGITKAFNIHRAVLEIRLQVLNIYYKKNPWFFGRNFEYEVSESEEGNNFPILPLLEFSLKL